MNLPFDPQVLRWVIPPVAGGIIGYVTNAIAIKMLFRPLEAKYLFGMRIPFTPGILPRQRYKLSESISNMVARDLLSEDVFVKRITSPEVAEGLSRSIAGFITSLSQDKEGASRTGLNNMLNELQDSGLPVQLLERIYPVFTVKLEEFLCRSDVRGTLIKYGHVLLSDVLENLSTFQRLMLTMGNYNTQLQESMPEIIDSFTARLMELLKSDTIRAQIISVIAGMLTPETLAQVLEKSGTLASRAEYFADLISKKVLSTAASAVPAVLKRLDIRKIVTDKIDSLAMEQVEGLVFGIMKSQFKWINIFGGILGALIGVLQSALSVLL